MPEIEILWERNLELSLIKWGESNLPEYRLNSNHNLNIKTHWKNYKQKHPDDYDGTLLYLYDFDFKKGELVLNLGTIKFSTVIYMANQGFRVERGLGMMGVQCLIFNQNKNYILLGRRSSDQTYYPGAITIPGGMLEIEDLNAPPSISLMREVKEEVNLEFQNRVQLNAILSGWNGISITFLISTKISNEVNLHEKIDASRDEWDNGLEWMTLRQLIRLEKSHTILDGLRYYIDVKKNDSK